MAWLDTLFHMMVEEGASDLHMTSSLPPMLRIDGTIRPVEGYAVVTPDQMIGVLREIAPDIGRQQFEADGDTDFAYQLEGAGRFRANYFRDHKGPGAVFRLIPSEIMTFEQLGLPKAVRDLCHLSKGLVVVTGPTGSGKSTTLAAMVDYINRTRREHIITIEDPIEFVHPGKQCLINQREVGTHTEGFKRALRAALREDPDIVLVGEMRDLETVEIAIETAETGHLVFGTLHTTTAPSTVDRVIDQFSADRQAQIRTMLSGSLKGVIAQTLCKRKPKGRVAALEIMVCTSGIASNIREGKTHQLPSLMQMGGKYGMKLLNDSLMDLVQQGLVDPVEAYMKSVVKEDLVSRLQAAGIPLDLSKLAEPDDSPASTAPVQNQGTLGEAAVAPSLVRTSALDMIQDQPAPEAPLPREQQQQPAQQPQRAPGNTPGYVDPFEQFKKGQP